MIRRQSAATRGAAVRGRRPLAWAVGLGALVLLLVGGAALAVLAPRVGQERAGGADPPQTPGTAREEAPTPETTVQSAPPLEVTTLPEETTASAAPESTTPNPYGLQPEGEEQVREAVENYYLAVDYKNWEYTYYNLDSKSKALFTEDEWIEKNQWYADNEGLELDSMEIDVTMDGSTGAEVTVYRTFTDGTSITRETYFVWEDGRWRHRLTEEEKAIFMPGVPYEEFVAAQQGEMSEEGFATSGSSTGATASSEASSETTGDGPCEAIATDAFEVVSCQAYRTDLDGISERSLSFMSLVLLR
ncbi:MAG: hypothetical protein M3R38_09650 [Actinomycetota bacterium]|nr:hypothetical protein [Actinomycetota bacterium]